MKPRAVTLGLGLRRPDGRRVPLDPADPVRSLASLVGAHAGDEAWWAPFEFEGDRRSRDAWRSSSAVVVDLDYLTPPPAGESEWVHSAVPENVAAAAERLLAPLLNLSHRTPRGLRAVFVLDEPEPDGDLQDDAARGAALLVETAVHELLPFGDSGGLSVDQTPVLDRARLFYSPRATVQGVARTGAFRVLLPEPTRTARLVAAGVAGRAGSSERQVESGSARSDRTDRPGDDYNRRGNVRALLERRGAVLARSAAGGIEHWRRPGARTRGIDATVREIDGVPLLYVFSPSWKPFEPRHAYSPFQVLSLLEHGGDFRAAARALAGEGFGAPRPHATAGSGDAGGNGTAPATAATPAPLPGPDSERFSDSGNAARLVRDHGEDLRFCYPWNKWLAWDGARWCPDRTGEIERRALRSVRGIFREALDAATPAEAKALARWAVKSLSRAGSSNAAEMARSRVAVLPDLLDRDPWALCCPNGVVDLRSGALRPHAKADMITKLCPTPFDPAAPAPIWERFLDRIFGRELVTTEGTSWEPNRLLIEYLQRAAGYSATGSVRDHALFFCYGTGANGKACCLNTYIPTPTGWTTQGALRPGDLVFDERGVPCRVLALSDTWTDRPCFRVRFSDGTSVVADAEHEWRVSDYVGRESTRMTREIADNVVVRVRPTTGACRGGTEYRWRVAMAGALTLPDADLPLDPYVLGYWLGNGSTGGPQIATHEDDSGHVAGRFSNAGYFCSFGRVKGRGRTLTFRTTERRYGCGMRGGSARAKLARAEVLDNKHVPPAYLRASARQRLALLQGLMDSDGHALKRQAQCEYCSTSRALANGVLELARSLGLRPTLSEGRARLNGVDHGPKFRVIFTTVPGLDVFSSPRKLGACRPRSLPLFRSVVACYPVAPVPVRCVEVDSPSHLYLVGEGMVPTHNSTWLGALQHVLGTDYADKAPPELLLAKRGEHHPTELADLHGKRLVSTIEVGEGRAMAEAIVKEITGGDLIKARRMREDFWSFEPTHKVWLAANHKPDVRGTDVGIWRRIRLIPFSVVVPEAERDPELPEKLRAEAPGILAWIVRGAVAWFAGGLRDPEAVREATAEYRSEQDVVGEWITDRCALSPHAAAFASDLYGDYRNWALKRGEDPLTQTAFSLRLSERGLEKRKSSRHSGRKIEYRGIALATQDAHWSEGPGERNREPGEE